jgi:hypothetical protein
MGNDQPALRVLFACESGLSEPEIGLEHAFVLLIWQKKHDKWKSSHGARLQKQLQTALILSVTFIRSHYVLRGKSGNSHFINGKLIVAK